MRDKHQRAILLGCMAWVATFAIAAAAQEATGTTAWKDGHFEVDVPGVVGRSDIVLNRPNRNRTEAMSLGNGRLGIAVWSAEGYTAQLNREDTWPRRLSPGQVVVPGLEKLSAAPDYRARVDLYNGEFVESGGGMTATTYVDAGTDAMVLAVTGASPAVEQTAELRLWPGRSPKPFTSGTAGVLAETWRDTEEMGASGLTFGSLSAISADASDVQVEADGALRIKVRFHPKADGTFRILVGSPEWRGGDAMGAGEKLLSAAQSVSPEEHRASWHAFWNSVGLMKLSSANGEAEYFENLRAIDLFTTAAESRDRFPGGQAGIGDLFSSFGDNHQWGPSAYWHWNLRMQVSANLGAGMAGFNEPYFNLYADNMDAIAKWTRDHMGGRRGLCVPETMRFDGAGYENETWIKSAGINCTEDGRPYYNARTISTGAEIALWVWQQYLYTDDKEFLESNYPLMRESARFLLAYAKRDVHGELYTYPSNAHESHWDVKNPTTDISAMRALFPVLGEAAQALGIDDEVVDAAKAAIPHLPELPLIVPGEHALLPASDKDDQHAVIASSYMPNAISHNSENIGLEPVWPYGLIGDSGPLHALGMRTFASRPNKAEADWSADPVQAARLGLAEEMKATLEKITERYQFYPNGLAQLTDAPEFYVEQVGVTADALQNGLVQDYDGLIRILPAWPKEWSADGTVVVEHGDRVDVQVHDGTLATLVIEGRHDGEVRIRNPWPGRSVVFSAGNATRPSILQEQSQILRIAVQKGISYRIAPENAATVQTFQAVSGTQAKEPKKLGTRSIGLAR